jgi:hypothetical protein
VFVLRVSGDGLEGFTEFAVVKEAVQEGGAWASGTDTESFGGEVFSGVGSVL